MATQSSTYQQKWGFATSTSTLEKLLNENELAFREEFGKATHIEGRARRVRIVGDETFLIFMERMEGIKSFQEPIVVTIKGQRQLVISIKNGNSLLLKCSDLSYSKGLDFSNCILVDVK